MRTSAVLTGMYARTGKGFAKKSMAARVHSSALSEDLRGAVIGWKTDMMSVRACAHTLVGQGTQTRSCRRLTGSYIYRFLTVSKKVKSTKCNCGKCFSFVFVGTWQITVISPQAPEPDSPIRASLSERLLLWPIPLLVYQYIICLYSYSLVP